jgi:NAD+ kinase
MRIAFFGKHIPQASLPYIQQLVDATATMGADHYIYQPFYQQMAQGVVFRSKPLLFYDFSEVESKVDFLFSIGGDGTLLDATGLVGDSGIPVAGINIGRLGFLSGISKEMILPALQALQNGDFLLEKRSLLLLESPEGLFGKSCFAMNEITVYKPQVISMLAIKAWINDQFLNAYWADGLIIATPTGSTAYSLSCNGPILTPDAEAFLITPIASHNLTVRPIVIRDDSVIRLKVEGKSDHYLVSLDSRNQEIRHDTELVIRKAPFGINLLRLRDKNFFLTIREKLNWGLDNRN